MKLTELTSLNKLKNKEEIKISKFDTNVKNTSQTSLIPEGKTPVILKLPSREESEQKVDNNKSFFSVIWYCICCCKKSSENKTKNKIEINSSFFDNFDQTKHDFVDIKSSLLDKDPVDHTDLLGVTAEASNI